MQQQLFTLPSPLSPTTNMLWCLYSLLVYAAAASHRAESALSDNHFALVSI
jgi:hypothetical protein